VPFAFVTGYSKDVLPPPYRDRPLLQKSFRTQAVLATLAMIIALPRTRSRGLALTALRPAKARAASRKSSERYSFSGAVYIITSRSTRMIPSHSVLRDTRPMGLNKVLAEPRNGYVRR
jgi:hypothetical protein